LTAEGDNRVLMVKVVKDMLVNHFKKGAELPKYFDEKLTKEVDVLNLNSLLNLFKKR
jgi:spore coat polysaccharide biosynthesis protein SpsF (cytidylyltransferase family)